MPILIECQFKKIRTSRRRSSGQIHKSSSIVVCPTGVTSVTGGRLIQFTESNPDKKLYQISNLTALKFAEHKKHLTSEEECWISRPRDVPKTKYLRVLEGFDKNIERRWLLIYEFVVALNTIIAEYELAQTGVKLSLSFRDEGAHQQLSFQFNSRKEELYLSASLNPEYFKEDVPALIAKRFKQLIAFTPDFVGYLKDTCGNKLVAGLDLEALISSNVKKQLF